MFFFPSFFFPPFTPSLFVKSCRQCTFTSAYTAHKSPKPDVLLNVLIKPISSVERVARLQCKPARGHACEKENNNESLQHPVHTAAVPPPSNTHMFRPVQTCPSPRCVPCSGLFPPQERNGPNSTNRKKICLSYSSLAPPEHQLTAERALQETPVLEPRALNESLQSKAAPRRWTVPT